VPYTHILTHLFVYWDPKKVIIAGVTYSTLKVSKIKCTVLLSE